MVEGREKGSYFYVVVGRQVLGSARYQGKMLLRGDVAFAELLASFGRT